MRYILLIVISFLHYVVISQTLLPTPRNIQATYNKGTRSVTGEPGKNYWQNTANYDLNIQFDPGTRLLTGVADIVYINNSPDTLHQIVFKLYPNIYQKGAPRQVSISADDLTDGMIIDSLQINNSIIPPDAIRVNATNGTLRNQPIGPGQKIHFRISYHYTLNKRSHIRTGEIAPGAAFIAYFFPRIAVYDDIDGWNTIPYTGTQEFYNDFCHFSAAITVPSHFIVWATGDLENGSEVLSPAFYRRLQEAEQNDAMSWIVDTTDLRKGNITNTSKTHNTWHFDADDVVDFAFAVSDHYVWQSSSLVVDPKTKRRTRVDAAFNPKHHDYFYVAGDARKTVEIMSYTFPAWPFPYSHITVFDGLDQMEYPMMVNDNPVEDRHESITLTDHEVFHTMFPFYMGTNETKYAWMDEGWATIGEWLISPMIDSTIVDEYGVAPTALNAGNETDLPIITPSTEWNRAYFTNAYPKPAMGYLYVKDYLGDALFTKALHHYIRQWKGKHPMPNDFFYCMNEGAGKNMNWFWKKWFFENGIPDLAITSVKRSGKKVNVLITSKGSKPVPVDIVIEYKDGSKQRIHRNIGVWEKGNKTVTVSFVTAKAIELLKLYHPHTPDSYPQDNTYEIK
ncbi:MAG: M1 family metallopeptidase [Chitinophagaceae bacterium]|nr:M1 family metallopeptidase [Chitinophagaceae bacterium]